MSPPKKLDYRMMPERAEQGLHDLATDIRDALRRHESQEIKTTESDGKIINTINVYPNGTISQPSVKFRFVKDLWTVLVMTGIIVGVYIIITNPGAIINFGNWLHNLFI